MTQGILFKVEKVIIPTEMRIEMLKIIYRSHLGTEKCKHRARNSLYWPGMSSGLEYFVSTCEICSVYQRKNRKNTSSLMLYLDAHGLKLQNCLIFKTTIISF